MIALKNNLARLALISMLLCSVAFVTPTTQAAPVESQGVIVGI